MDFWPSFLYSKKSLSFLYVLSHLMSVTERWAESGAGILPIDTNNKSTNIWPFFFFLLSLQSHRKSGDWWVSAWFQRWFVLKYFPVFIGSLEFKHVCYWKQFLTEKCSLKWMGKHLFLSKLFSPPQPPTPVLSIDRHGKLKVCTKRQVFFSFGIFHLLKYAVYLNSFEVNGSLFIDFNGSWIRPLVKSNVQRHCANIRLETNPFRWVAPNGSLGFAWGGWCLLGHDLFPLSVLHYMQPTFCYPDPAYLGWEIEKTIFLQQVESEAWNKIDAGH